MAGPARRYCGTVQRLCQYSPYRCRARSCPGMRPAAERQGHRLIANCVWRFRIPRPPVTLSKQSLKNNTWSVSPPLSVVNAWRSSPSEPLLATARVIYKSDDQPGDQILTGQFIPGIRLVRVYHQFRPARFRQSRRHCQSRDQYRQIWQLSHQSHPEGPFSRSSQVPLSLLRSLFL